MIKYKDLSAGLKIAVILAWIAGSVVCVSFIWGFIIGWMAAM